MADIQLRFNQDMLILSSPIRRQLQSLGLDTDRDMEMMFLLEPEALDEIYTLDVAVGVQCLVADASAITPARLTHLRLGTQGKAIAEAAINTAASAHPQHILAEIGPCGLPMDASSKASLVEHRDQYTRAVDYLIDAEPLFDAYFLNGFTSTTEIKCALMGMRKVTDKPIFVSVVIDDATIAMGDIRLAGVTSDALSAAVEIIAEYGGQVVGFETSAGPNNAADIAKTIRQCTATIPILAQLNVGEVDPEQNAPTADNPYFEADTMVDAADTLRVSGVQFIRAVGDATSAYTGALVAATIGDEVVLDNETNIQASTPATDSDLQKLGNDLRNKINAALNIGKN